MAYIEPPTTKGARQAEEILEAALRCLGRDGYAATSLGRIAEEAGVNKRMVLYYFGSRSGLFDQLTEQIGDRLLERLEVAIRGLTEPGEVVVAGFEGLWEAITSDRALLIGFFGVMTESVTDDELRRTVSRVKGRFRTMLRAQIDAARSSGRKILVDDDVAVTLMLAGFLGLAIDYLERGETPELRASMERFQQLVAAMAPAA